MSRDAKLEVVVGGEKHDFSIQEELMIDRDDLDTELARQAAHYAWFAVLHERARYQKARMEEEYEQMEDEIYLELRAKPYDKRLTEATFKAKVRTDPRLIRARRNFQKADHDERLLGKIVDALYQRKDCLVALARSRHLEMSTPSADEVERIKKNLLGR